MAEFYVTNEHLGEKYLAVVIAQMSPTRWRFASIDELEAEMNALGHPWELQCPIRVGQEFGLDDQSDACQHRLVELRELRERR